MNKRSMRILGFSQIRDMLVRLAPSRLSKEAARALKPDTDEDTVVKSLTDTEEAVVCLEREGQIPLGGITDIRPFLEKAKREVTLSADECIAVWENAQRYGQIQDFFAPKEAEYPQLSQRAETLGDFSLLVQRVGAVFDENHQVRDNASVELARLRTRIAELERRTKRYIQQILADKSYQKYFQDTLVTVRNNRSVIPVKQEYRHAFPGIVHDMSASGATLYVEPLAVVDANNDLQTAKLAEEKEIERIYRRLTALIAGQYEELYKSTMTTGELEFALTKGRLALQMKATRPQLTSERIIKLYDARHPLIKADKVVANTIILGGDYSILLITGSNTGGKTVSMKTLGLLVLMYQSGLFIPVSDGSQLPLFGDVFADIGDEQDIAQNLSTFSSHMKQIVYILKHASACDLILTDELGSGTDPGEGGALAIAILDEFRRKGSLAMVTTHYNDLKNYAYRTEGVENGHVEFDTETLRPTYKLRIGSAGSSHALAISERLGMPEAVLEEAHRLRNEAQDADVEAVLTRLNTQLRKIDEERELLATRLKEAKAHEEALRKEKEKVTAKRQDIVDASRREANELKRNLRLEAEQIIRELKRQSSDASDREKAKAIDQARRAIQQISVPELSGPKRDPVDVKRLKQGQSVFVNSLNSIGTVDDIRGKKLTVSVRGMTIRVDVSDISAPYADELSRQKVAEKRENTSSTYRPARTGQVATELNVIGKHGNEAIPHISRFLDQALAAGFSPVRIIHGKGSGALRKQVHEYLDTLPFVTSYTLDDARNGGDGVTLVYF
mgnify:FL=1